MREILVLRYGTEAVRARVGIMTQKIQIRH